MRRYSSKTDNLFEIFDNEDKLEMLSESDLQEATLGDVSKERAAGNDRKWYTDLNDDDLDEAERRIKQILQRPEEQRKPGLIEKTLDRALRTALWAQEDGSGAKHCTNVLFSGPAGTGKTSRIVDWAKRNDINLVHVLASTMDDTDLGGAITPDNTGEIVKRLATTEFDELGDTKNSVLFLDEFNRAPHSVRGTLLTLIQDHTIPDPRVKGKRRYLPNFLFTVAAINPAGENFNTDELDQAELTRFRQIQALADKSVGMEWLADQQAKRYDKEMNRTTTSPEEKQRRLTELKRKLMLIDKLADDPDFDYDSAEEIADSTNGLTTTARTLNNLIDSCDGTRKDFLDQWDEFCNPATKYKAEKALRDFKDIQNKANSVFAKNSEKKGDVDFIKLL